MTIEELIAMIEGELVELRNQISSVDETRATLAEIIGQKMDATRLLSGLLQEEP